MRALHDMPRVTVVLVRLGGSSRLQNLSLTPQLSQQTSCKTSLHIIKGITHPSPPHPQRSINFTYVHYFSLKVQTLLLGLFHMRWPRCAGAVAFRDELFCFTDWCYCTALGAEGKLLHSESLTWKGFDVSGSCAPLLFLTGGEDAAPAVLHMQPHLSIPPAGNVTAITLVQS